MICTTSSRTRAPRRARPARWCPLAPAAAALLLATAASAAPGAAVPPGLSSLLGASRTVVLGRVADVEAYDSGRVAVAAIEVRRTLKGDEVDRVQVVEMRDLASVPPALVEGEHVVAFLDSAARTSYLRSTLPDGTYLQPARGRQSVIASPDQAAASEAAEIVARLVAGSRAPEPDPAKRRAARRTLTFDEIAARHPAVVEDGVAGLADLGSAASGAAAQGASGQAPSAAAAEPSPEERLRLERALARADLPARLRVRLVDRIAANGWSSLVPALRRLGETPAADAAVVAASWRALDRLGAAPDPERLARALGDPDPERRAAAARALLDAQGVAEIERAGSLAVSDPDVGVRVEVIDALAGTGSPAALPTLERAFADSRWEIRQAAGRAIFQIGGRPAAESFARLSFTGPLEGQRYAVTLLRASGVAGDDPLLAKIRAEHPDAQVREIVEHGLPFHEH